MPPSPLERGNFILSILDTGKNFCTVSMKGAKDSCVLFARILYKMT